MSKGSWLSRLLGQKREEAPAPGRGDFQVGQVLRSSTTGRTFEVLGMKKGGFGAVYVVREENYAELCVLKTFQARYLWSDEDRERFEREAITWVMLDRHPNIVTAHCVERVEGFPCLLLEYVSGGDLAHHLRGGPLSLERALELALHFCDGMAYAHRKLGIVHRDVKPANCLLTEDGTLKVTDFGLARAFGEAQERLLGISHLGGDVRTQYTTIAGTIQYMAPEQFRAGARLDTRTDIYSFGIMLCQMLTGDLPDIGSAARAHVRANAASYQIPDGLLRLILRCVEPDARGRPADFAEVREALTAAQRTTTGKAGPPPAEQWPMDADELNNKGLALRALGRYQEALDCFERGLDIDPHISYLWQNKGLALRALGREREALVCYDRSIEIAPGDSNLWKNKGYVLVDLGRYDEALACFEQGLKIAPQDSGLWLNMGAALGELRRHQEALQCFDRGLEINPRSANLWLNKGIMLEELRRYEEALVCYDRGLEIEPRNSSLWKNKGLTLRAMGRTREAKVWFRRAKELDRG